MSTLIQYEYEYSYSSRVNLEYRHQTETGIGSLGWLVGWCLSEFSGHTKLGLSHITLRHVTSARQIGGRGFEQAKVKGVLVQ